MYERFTDRARKCLQLANHEAQRLNHEYIGTEHILLGLVKEGSGVASTVLKNLGIDLRKIKLEVEKLIQSGPDMVTMGKMPQTPRAKKVIENAIVEARNLNHNWVGTEHLLLGLLDEFDGLAGNVLRSFGIGPGAVRQSVIDLYANQDMPSRIKESPPPTYTGAVQGVVNPNEDLISKLMAITVMLTEIISSLRNQNTGTWTTNIEVKNDS